MARGSIVKSHYSNTLFNDYDTQLPLFQSEQPQHQNNPPKVIQLFDMTDRIISEIQEDYGRIYTIGDENFERVVERLFQRMNYFVFRPPGGSRQRDGGIDIYAIPKGVAHPYFIGIQTKLKEPGNKIGPNDVRAFSHVIQHKFPLNAGFFVTNTDFTLQARLEFKSDWHKIKLSNHQDLAKWIAGKFLPEHEWRLAPRRIEYCPGKWLDIPRPFEDDNEQQSTFLSA